MTQETTYTKILVVGSWAKEQITIENIRKKSGVTVFAYMSTKNPGILSLVDGYELGELDDKTHIVEYAVKQKIDLVLITTAQPLSVGVADALEQRGIPVFGPSKTAAQLEYDKAYTRKLMKTYGIGALPKFEVFTDQKKALQYAEELDWNVAVKPIGLTEGLGVKIFDDHLKNKDDVASYIDTIFDKKIGGDAKVLIEEKLVGNEFTIQCFVCGSQVIPTPAVQDFKRLLPGDKGPNTASMGSYSDKGFLLPFMTQKDYDQAVGIITSTLDAFQKETGETCKGFLYGQFMKTNQGIKLIEYNFRPGDPEWLNTVAIMDGNLIDIIQHLTDGTPQLIQFEDKATVCKYIVPEHYPKMMNQILEVAFDPKIILDLGVQTYYSCGLDTTGALHVGSERGIAFISKADSIIKAREIIENAISKVTGKFFYRKDIGMIPTNS